MHNYATDLQTVLATDQPFTQREGRLDVAGVGPLTVDYSVTPVAGHHTTSKTAFLLLEFQPLDRKLNIDREDQHVSSQRTTRMLISGMAHEVKNPLGGIRGSAQLLEAELNDPALKEYTQVIIEEADRLRNLVDRLLGPNQPPKFAATNIHRVLEHVLRVSFAELAVPPIIKRSYDPSIPHLDADYDQLVQAFMNVIRNALQALGDSEGQPHLTLRTKTLRRFTIGDTNHRLVVQVDVEDNGPGIPADIRDRLFFPMISGRAEGSGLGLSITQTIVSQHNGLIGLTSDPGCTCFSIYLPLEQKTADGPCITHASQ